MTFRTPSTHFGHLGMLLMAEVNRMVDVFQFVQNHDFLLGQTQFTMSYIMSQTEFLAQAIVTMSGKRAGMAQGTGRVSRRLWYIILKREEGSCYQQDPSQNQGQAPNRSMLGRFGMISSPHYLSFPVGFLLSLFGATRFFEKITNKMK